MCEREKVERGCMCLSVSASLCVYILSVYCIERVCVCVGLLYTALGAKTLEIALIWILCVSSNHNHVTGSPRQERLIHGAERRPSCMLLLYVHFILQELCSQNGFIHIPRKPHNADGRKKVFTDIGEDVAHNQICLYLGISAAVNSLVKTMKQQQYQKCSGRFVRSGLAHLE